VTPRELEGRRAHFARVASRRPLAVSLVGCGKAKRAHACKAEALYTGSLFTASLSHARATSDVVFVVSALHGLVELDEVLEPYDAKLEPAQGYEWAQRVLASLNRTIGHWPRQITILAGATYAQPLRLVMLGKCLSPLDGLTLGARLRWLTLRRAERIRAADFARSNPQ